MKNFFKNFKAKDFAMIMSMACGIGMITGICLDNIMAICVFGICDINFYLQYLNCKIDEIKNK